MTDGKRAEGWRRVWRLEPCELRYCKTGQHLPSSKLAQRHRYLVALQAEREARARGYQGSSGSI